MGGEGLDSGRGGGGVGFRWGMWVQLGVWVQVGGGRFVQVGGVQVGRGVV